MNFSLVFSCRILVFSGVFQHFPVIRCFPVFPVTVMLLLQIGLQLKLPIWGNNSIHALSMLQTGFIYFCFVMFGIGPSI